METETNSQALSVACTPEVSAVAANEERSTFLVMSSTVAPEYHAEKRAPVDMICVIDRSGSMSGERINMAKSTVEFVVENLQREDRLGIVTYDDHVINHFPLTAMTSEGKEAATAAVKRIAVGGSTNLCGGLVEGINQMRNRAGSKNEVASVLLFTDGQANVGYVSAEDIIKATLNADFAAGHSPQSRNAYSRAPMSRNAYSTFQPQPQVFQQQQYFQAPQQLHQQLPQQQQQQFFQPQQSVPPQWGQPQVAVPVAVGQNPTDLTSTSTEEEDPKKKKNEEDSKDVPLPCTINTFGFGSDHDATLLKKIADHGQGMYYFIDSAKSISEAYADCLAGLLSVVAQDIKLSFEVPQGAPVTINRIVTKFKCTELERGRAYELALGDIQSEERRDILIEVSLKSTGGVVESGVPILKTTVTYTNVITGQREATASHTATIDRPREPTGEARNYLVDKQFNRLLAAEAMEQSNEAARAGDLERARAILKRAGDRIKESVSREDAFCKDLVTDLVRCEGGLVSHSSYAAGGSKMLSNQMQAHYVQRSTNVGWGGQQAYQGAARNQMQAKFNTKFS